MTLLLVLLLVAAAVAAALYLRRRSRQEARRRLAETPLTEAQRAVIAREVPLTQKLPPRLRGAFEGKINLFLDQIEFVGCNGLEVTEEIRLSIAAQACLLVAASDTWYDHLATVLVYPGAFKSTRTEHNGYVVTRREVARTGESWSRGPVVLSWADSREGAMNDHDGRNVVFHEFAHQIDDLSGRTDGVPNLDRSQSFAGWERAFADAYDRHVHHVRAGMGTVLNPYGAEGRQEFFAVAVEAFFETPGALKGAEPAVYAELVKLFHLEPADWGEARHA